MALSDFFDFSKIFQLIKSFLGPFGKLIDKLTEVWNHLTNILSSAEKLKDSVIVEIDGWKNFKQDIRIRQRVVQLESAIQKTRDLIEGIPASWRAIVDIVKQFKGQLGETNPVEEADVAATELEEGGIKSLLTKFPALARGLEKALGFLAIVVQALEAIANTIDDLQTVVNELKGFRLELEKLDTIFLSQSNKRRIVKLSDGTTMRIRVGHLHS